MNVPVLLFFFHNVLATILLGGKFVIQQSPRFRLFGMGLLINSIAFLVWAGSVAIHPTQAVLDIYVTIGSLFFLVALILFLITATRGNTIVATLGALLGVIIFLIRIAIYPSSPEISSEGFFFFNPHPAMEMIYILALLLAGVPAIEAIAREIPSQIFSNIFRYGFLVEIACGIVLLTSTIGAQGSIVTLYVTGWIAGCIYLLLWLTFLFHPDALPSNDNNKEYKEYNTNEKHEEAE